MARPKKEETKRSHKYEPRNPLKLPASFMQKLEQDGMIHRWVRVKDTNGAYDHKNVGKRKSEGWEFVDESEFDKDDPFIFGVQIEDVGRLRGVITVGDLALAKHYKEFKESRNAHFAQRSQELVEANNMEIKLQNQGPVPMDTNNSKVEETLGSRPVDFE